ncbi:hypothetical protein [Nocardioides sp. NPDC047086]|uniref:hypothetical protein n=1 Tax=Nocardioides sp. NPDC047086 TaxID=3154810 RepID=UPI00340EB93B
MSGTRTSLAPLGGTPSASAAIPERSGAGCRRRRGPAFPQHPNTSVWSSSEACGHEPYDSRQENAMNSKVLGGLRRSVAVTLVAGGLTVAGAAVAHADSQSVGQADGRAASAAQQPIKAPDRGPAGPVTVSGAVAGNDGAVTVATDGTTVVVSGRAHLESPVDNAAGGGVVHHDDDARSPLGRGADLGTDQLGFAGGATGDSSSVDAVGTARVGAEKHYYVQDVTGPDGS